MKYKIVFAALIFFLLVAWIRINRETYTPPPLNYTEISKTVNLKFKVTNKDVNSVEMALNEGRGSNNLFVVFELFDGWYKGNLGLVLKDMSESSSLKSSSGKKADISKFEKDNKGEKINLYSFDQILVKDDKGESYIQMIYVGPDMPLIQSLKVEKNLKLPRHISARFVNNSNIEFLAGTYGLDPKINGFWIPVKVS